MILLTGATTHTGSKLAHYLIEKGENIRCITRNDEKLNYLPNQGEEIKIGDLNDEKFMEECFEGVSAVINIAHISFAPMIIKACVKANVKRVIFMSSTRRYTKFHSESAIKVINSEEQIRNSNLDYTIIRPSMIYGDQRDNNITHLVNFIKRHKTFPMIGNGKNLVQPLFVWDLVYTIYNVLKNDKTIRKEYILSGPQAIEYDYMLKTIADDINKKIYIIHAPYKLMYFIAKIYTLFSKKPLLTLEQVQRFGEDKCFDISKAKQELGFNPTSFEEGIKRKLSGNV